MVLEAGELGYKCESIFDIKSLSVGAIEDCLVAESFQPPLTSPNLNVPELFWDCNGFNFGSRKNLGCVVFVILTLSRFLFSCWLVFEKW